MDRRIEVVGQWGQPAVTVLVTAALALAPGTPSAAIPYATDHRSGHLSGGGLEKKESALDLEPVGDPTPAAGLATYNYKATWRAVPDAATIAELKRLGLWWFEGGPTDIGADRRRLNLSVDAFSPGEAEQILRNVIEAGDKGPANITIVEPTAASQERVRRMVAALEQAREDDTSQS